MYHCATNSKTNCAVDHAVMEKTVTDMLGAAEAWDVKQLAVLARLGKGFLIYCDAGVLIFNRSHTNRFCTSQWKEAETGNH